MSVKRWIVGVLVTLIALSLPLTAAAAEAEGFVKAKQTELMSLLKRGKSTSNNQKIEAIFDDMLDYDAIAKESLGEHWDERSEAEKKEFRGILKQLVQRAYRKNLSKTLNYDLSYLGESKAKGDSTLVKTVAKDRKNAREEPVTIDFNVHKVGSQLKIRDIVTEGSSLTSNYRSQFRRIIKKKGFDELIKRMKTKLEKDEA